MILPDDAMGRPLSAVPVSVDRLAIVLVAGSSRMVPVPAGARLLLLNATSSVWVQYGGPASVPVTDITDGQAPELNPGLRDIKDVALLGLAAAGDCVVSLAFYR